MDSTAQDADEAVRRFAGALREIRSRLFAGLPGVTGVHEMLRAVNSDRTLPRAGRSTTGIEYSVHGIGCRMTDERGREVDVDVEVLPDGSAVEVFDHYRIRWFTYDDEDGELTGDDLLAACLRLADQGELVDVAAGGRWFALPPARA